MKVNYRVKVVEFEVVRRVGSPDARVLNKPGRVARLVRDARLIPDDAKQHFGVFAVDAGLRLIAWHEASAGSLDGCLVQPREVFAPAFRLVGVDGVIFVHNHPSGNPDPSEHDITASIRDRLFADLLKSIKWQVSSISIGYIAGLGFGGAIAAFVGGFAGAAGHTIPALVDYVQARRNAQRKNAFGYLIGLADEAP